MYVCLRYLLTRYVVVEEQRLSRRRSVGNPRHW